MRTTTYEVKLKFIAPILGSQPTDKEIASKFIAKKKGLDQLPREDDELLPEALEKGTTVFYRTAAGEPAFMNYQVLGFLKEAGRILSDRSMDVPGRRMPKNLRAKVSQLVSVSPRVIPITMPNGQNWEDALEILERPLRAETAQGPRTALAMSEMFPEGCTLTFGLEVIDGKATNPDETPVRGRKTAKPAVADDIIDKEVLSEILSYGYMHGLGQWRGSGAYGNFIYEITCQD
jgi:hypothetical protein